MSTRETVTSGRLRYVALESGGYQVAEDWWCEDPCLAGLPARLNDGTAQLIDSIADGKRVGRLVIKKGFRCDGGSGPARDTPGGMYGFVAHDALYRMMRQRKLPQSWRVKAERIMYRLHRLGRVSWARAQWLWAGCRLFSGYAAKPRRSPESVVLVAP